MTSLALLSPQAAPLFRRHCNGMITRLLARPSFVNATRRGPLFLSAAVFFLKVHSDNCRRFTTQNEATYQTILARTVDMVLHGEMIMHKIRSNVIDDSSLRYIRFRAHVPLQSLYERRPSLLPHWHTLNSAMLRAFIQWKLVKKAPQSTSKRKSSGKGKSEAEPSTGGGAHPSSQKNESLSSGSGPGDTSGVALKHGRIGSACRPSDYDHTPDWDW